MSSSSSHTQAGAPGASPPSATIKDSDSPGGGGDESRSSGTTGAGTSPDKAQKPHKPLNRVPRACNACRKQKMKCTDADNPPCKRCRTAGIECIFEKPVRDTLSNNEQGIRIRYLETQVTSIQSTLTELVSSLRAAVPQASLPMPSSHASSSAIPQSAVNQAQAPPPMHAQQASPANYGAPSPSTSAHSASLPSNTGSGPQTEQVAAQQAQYHQNYPMQNHPQYPQHQMPPSMRQNRSASSSSSNRTGGGHYSSPSASYPPHLSPSQNGMPQEPHLEHAHRGNDAMQQPFVDHRSGHVNHQHNQYPAHYGQYPGGQHQVPQLQQAQHYTSTESQQQQQHPPMPPPQSLPPFSELDVHPRSHQAPGPPLHVHTAVQRGPFTGPNATRKNSQPAISPINGYNVAHGVPQHHYHGQQIPGASGHHQQYHHYTDLMHNEKQSGSGADSGVTSADSSDDEGGLPTHGMVAPFVAIRVLADAADQEDGTESLPPTRSGSPARFGHANGAETQGLDASGRPDGRSTKRGGGKSGQGNDRPSKRRKTQQTAVSDDAIEGPTRAMPDVVTKGLIPEAEAKELFGIFFTGCSMFLPVFDATVDTYDALHRRSPFCVTAICMIAAKVRDGGGPPSETYKKCQREVQEMACGSLFTPVVRQEVVQAMIIIAGWGAGPKDSGWLTCGHATRMALELGINKAWPRLLKRMHAGKTSTTDEERDLVIQSRTWFCLYLFEHQMSFGTGRPAVLKEDESVHECRLLLTHPLAINDDMRLVSMVELMIIRERTHNMVMPADNAPIDTNTFNVLRQSKDNFEAWLKIWSGNFSKRYDKAAFHRQSLEAQVAFAELYHNATALRTIRGPDDVAKITPDQKELALRSMDIARGALEVCLRSPSYREGMKYAVQYTHLSATFTASFLMRLARLFPDDCDLPSILADVEDLTVTLTEIPATRYARTLKWMARTLKRRFTRSGDNSISSNAVEPPRSNSTPRANHFSPSEQPLMQAQPFGQPMMGHGDVMPQGLTYDGLDQYMRDFELLPGQEIPVWLSESNLGDLALSQQGLEAFLIPPSLDDHRAVPEIW